MSEKENQECDLHGKLCPNITVQMRSAVSDGVRDLLADKSAVSDAVAIFWATAFEQLQAQASAKTGQWVLGGVRAVISRMLVFVGLGMLVYSVGGWAAVLKFWHAIWSSS